ncbi:MAG: hypothetical protein JWQ78_1734 [Sediminibacterium sp.]|nr:hypothetical protein [Sediminibacterium sp.]
MRYAATILLSVMIGVFSACQNGTGPGDGAMDTTTFTTIHWLDSTVSFGAVNMGEQVTVTFRFRNTGNKPLVLSNVKAGCGCTVPDYTKGAIAPGGEGEVTGAFDTNKSHEGEVMKNIFVTTNTKHRTEHTLIFTGLIRAAPAKGR